MINSDIHLYILKKLNQIKHPSPIPLSTEILEYSQEDQTVIDNIIRRLSNDEPWEYICGKAHFCNKTFTVSPTVLIPRVETEQIVETVVERLRHENEVVQIIDTGTGSGAIILSIENLIKNTSNIYLGTDISLEALKIAEANKKDSSVKFVRANLLDSPEVRASIPTYIVANLPYIPSNQITSLQNSVKNFEPQIALDGGETGLKYYQELLEQIVEKDIDLRYAIFEYDPNTTNEFKSLLNRYPQFSYTIVKDIYEQDRFVEIERRPVS